MSISQKRKKRRIYIPGPDYRNTQRGSQWLKGIIEASEGKRSFKDVLDEMQPETQPERRSEESDT
jgi:hypothetical protein